MTAAPPAAKHVPPAKAPASTMPPPPAQQPQRDALTMLAIGIAVVTALYVGRDIVLPVVLAIFLAFVLTPIVNFLRRLRLPRAAAVILAVTMTLAFIGALTVVVTSQVGQLASDLPRYEATIESKVSGIQKSVLGPVSRMAERLGRRIQRAAESEEKAPEPSVDGPAPLPVEVHAPDLTPLQISQRFILPLLYPLATFAITFVVLIFILLQREDLRDRVIRLIGWRDIHRTTVAMDDAASRLSRFFLTQVALSLAYGAVATVFLWAIGVPSPILCGALAGAMRFVPYVGSIIAAAVPMILAIAVDPGWTTLALTMGFFLIGEPTMGYVVEPLVYGQSTGLSPFAVILSAIFWSWLWGPAGLLLAMPLTLCLVVLGRHVEAFRFLDVMLGDTPPLEPPQNFYQRMLANDADEALEHAEQILKDCSLAQYYDEVAMRGLALASRDAARGVLTPEQIEIIRTGVYALVADLAAMPDIETGRQASDADGKPHKPDGAEKAGGAPARESCEQDSRERNAAEDKSPEDESPDYDLPEAWRTPGAILCVAGRGPLDESAALLLADVLQKNGLGATIAPHASLAHGPAREIDVGTVKLACVCFVELQGAPAYLRFLLRRVRQSLPDAPIVAGLWEGDEPASAYDALRSQTGADHHVASLRQALEISLSQARAPVLQDVARTEAKARAARPLPLP